MANIERLQQGLRVLYEVRDQQKPFDIREWCYEDECGTTACALGWIAMDSWHNSQGLHLNVYDQPTFEPSLDAAPGRGYSSLEAAEQYFDISYSDAFRFFIAVAYSVPGVNITVEEVIDITVEEVIERMEAFLKKIQ